MQNLAKKSFFDGKSCRSYYNYIWGLIIYIGVKAMLKSQKERNKEKWRNQQVTQNRRQTTIQQFKRVQQQIPHRPADDHIIRIPNNINAPPRPVPGQQKKYDLRKNDPAVRQAEQMQQQTPNQAPKNVLSDQEKSNLSRLGMNKPGGIDPVMYKQQLPFGTGVAINNDPYNSNELLDGSKLLGSIVAEKAHERSWEEGGLSAEEINSDRKEGLGAPQGAPKPCQTNLDFKVG